MSDFETILKDEKAAADAEVLATKKQGNIDVFPLMSKRFNLGKAVTELERLRKKATITSMVYEPVSGRVSFILAES